MKLRESVKIKPGDVFFNVIRMSLLKVRAVGPEWAQYISWRPDGVRGSQIGKVRVTALTKTPYFKAQAVHVYTAGGSFGFGLTAENADRKPQEAGYLG
jgi:hypothetical protein